MNEFKQTKRFDMQLSDTSFSTTEDMLLRTTTEYLKSEPVAETLEYSTRLEEFIRSIIREEISKAFKQALEA